MYFVKNLIASKEERNEIIDFYEYHKIFNFLDWIYIGKRSEFRNILAQNPSFISDLAASIVAKLQESQLLKEDFIQKALECCEKILISQGYEPTHPNHLLSQGIPNSHCVMLIAGCQSRHILKSRVKKAFDLWQKLQKGFTFVFSGRNPSKTQKGRSKVSIINEAREMESYFYSLLEDPSARQLTYYTKRIDIDEDSYNTITNIDQFLTGDFINQKGLNSIYIVSSSFHLIRLAKNFENSLNSGSSSAKVKEIVLVGAEDSNKPSNIALDPTYLKSMMHDVFQFLMNESLELMNENKPVIPTSERFSWNKSDD